MAHVYAPEMVSMHGSAHIHDDDSGWKEVSAESLLQDARRERSVSLLRLRPGICPGLGSTAVGSNVRVMSEIQLDFASALIDAARGPARIRQAAFWLPIGRIELNDTQPRLR